MKETPIPQPEYFPKPRKNPLSPETIRSLQELGRLFREIHRELVAEGYVIRDGKIIKPGPENTNDGGNPHK